MNKKSEKIQRKMYYVLITNLKDKTIYDERGLLLDDNAIDNLIDMLLIAKEKNKYTDVQQYNNKLSKNYHDQITDKLKHKTSKKNYNRTKISHTKRERIFLRDKHKCFYCGKLLTRNTFQLDHKIPISRGGNNLDKNLVVACKICNLKKGTLTSKEFIAKGKQAYDQNY